MNMIPYNALVRIIAVVTVASGLTFAVAFTLVSLTPVVWLHVIGFMIGIVLLAVKSEL